MQQFWILFFPLLKVLAYVHMIMLLLLIQKAQHEPGRIWCMFRLSFRVLWTEPNEISSMSETWWKVIILFLKISSLTLSTPLSVFAYRWPHHYWIWKATKELCLPSKSYRQQLGTFCSIFPSLMHNLIQTPVTCATTLFQAENGSAHCPHLVVKFVLLAVVSFCGQPRNYLIAPCICIFTNKTWL